MFRAGHALDKPKMSRQDFESAEHVTVVSAGTGHARIDEFIARKGVQRHIKLTVPHFVAVAHILATTDMIATVPERYAMECVKPFGLIPITRNNVTDEIGGFFRLARRGRNP